MRRREILTHAALRPPAPGDDVARARCGRLFSIERIADGEPTCRHCLEVLERAERSAVRFPLPLTRAEIPRKPGGGR